MIGMITLKTFITGPYGINSAWYMYMVLVATKTPSILVNCRRNLL